MMNAEFPESTGPENPIYTQALIIHHSSFIISPMLSRTWLRAYVRRAVALLRLPERLDGVRVNLTEYPDADTLAFLRPGENLPEQRQINAAMAAEFRRRGGDVHLVTLHLADYFTWLARHDRRDGPATRAEFISWATHTSPADRESPPPPSD
jgi:hypothetical protein